MPTAKKPSNKQKQSLISKLKLNTLKGRMIATVLVFAIVGGGVMVYRSFAATAFDTSNVNAATLTFQRDAGKCNSTVVADTDGSKGTINVLNVMCPSDAYGKAIGSKWSPPGGYYNKTYRACARIKGTGEGGVGFGAVKSDGNIDVLKYATVALTSTYQTVCTSGLPMNSTGVPYLGLTYATTNPQLRGLAGVSNGQIRNIQYITIEEVASAPAPAPQK